MPDAVQPVDRGTFRVASASQPGRTHFVDLAANRGVGQCDCADFRCRPLHLCRHILAARDFVADCVVAAWVRSEASASPERAGETGHPPTYSPS